MSGAIAESVAHCCSFPHGGNSTLGKAKRLLSLAEQRTACIFARARASGPREITKDATVAEWRVDGSMSILHQGTNQWTCFPGNENIIGDVPMCCDPMGLQYVQDIIAGKPAPTNTAPGLVYMLCGASQHSNVDPFDTTSVPFPIGPHYMITWPYDSKRDGFPSNARDAGAWVMYDGTPYAYLHICGTPWAGTVYHPEKNPYAVWEMRYASEGHDYSANTVQTGSQAQIDTEAHL